MEKKAAGEKAAEYARDGMVIGLGTGSTVYYTIKKIGSMVNNGLKINAVSTSVHTTVLADSLGIKIIPLDDAGAIDLTIDGADEIDQECNAIKGGGGALLYEKIVAAASKKVIWVVDSGKFVEALGRFPLPVEVIPFGHRHIIERLKNEGMNPRLRLKDETPFITDSGNFIVDLKLGKIEEPEKLSLYLNSVPGIIENGLFLKTADMIISGRGESFEIINCKKN